MDGILDLPQSLRSRSPTGTNKKHDRAFCSELENEWSKLVVGIQLHLFTKISGTPKAKSD